MYVACRSRDVLAGSYLIEVRGSQVQLARLAVGPL